MEVYELKDRHLLLKLLGKLWEHDREAYYAFKEGLIILPLGETSDLVVLPGDGIQVLIDDARQWSLLEDQEGGAA